MGHRHHHRFGHFIDRAGGGVSEAAYSLPNRAIWQLIGCGPEDESDEPEIMDSDLVRM